MRANVLYLYDVNPAFAWDFFNEFMNYPSSKIVEIRRSGLYKDNLQTIIFPSYGHMSFTVQ